MRLERIKLVGFKSFVDPTAVDFPSQVMGIVGPNGCGKSNIIDAVRWVMGESSAKNLRGESLTDVIFNGTVERKPVGQASIELVFDNREGKLGGEYAQYSQISIKRQVTRDAQSSYFLNGTRCRRRDIVGVFLGTGLSPRSYSIIEQGTISRLIDAKPDEFRAHLEEASGISKYKERRRETENRIRHTKENLDRLNDLREEIDKHLQHLKRQANAAERYKVLKEEERLLKGQELALRWQEFNEQAKQLLVKLEEETTRLQERAREQQRIETEITKNREQQHDLLESHNEVQSRFYSLGSDINRIEQAMQHYKERRQQLQNDLSQAEQAWQALQMHYENDQQILTELTAMTKELTPELSIAQEQVLVSKTKLAAAEELVRGWQVKWDEFNKNAALSSKTAEVEQTQIRHIEQHHLETQKRLTNIVNEKTQLSSEESEAKLTGLEAELLDKTERVTKQEMLLADKLVELQTKRNLRQELAAKLDQLRSELQTEKGRLASLAALQQEALGKKDQVVNQWLAANNLSQASRLAELLTVEKGWEQAVEQVLNSYLEAVCVDEVTEIAARLNHLENFALTLFVPNSAGTTNSRLSYPRLADKVSGASGIVNLLNHVYIAPDLSQALAIAEQLATHESVVCANGIWLSKAWLKVANNAEVKAGVLLREQEIKMCQDKIATLESAAKECEQALAACHEAFNLLEQDRETLQQSLNQSRADLADGKAKISVLQAQIEQVQRRLTRLEGESASLQQQLQAAEGALENARAVWQQAMAAMEVDANIREELLQRRDENRQQLEAAHVKVRDENETLHRLEIQLKTTQSQINGLEQSLDRMEQQRESLQSRCQQLEAALSKGDFPLENMQAELTLALEKRVGVENELNAAKQALDESEYQMREFETQRYDIEQTIQSMRSKLEEKRIREQELKVRCSTLLEQLKELEFDLEITLSSIPEGTDKAIIAEQLAKVASQIQRLGAINLAAIDEFKVQSERKEYLDAQYADIEEALTTLENAIQKIDKETKTKFKETFDTVNQYFQEYFPRVFGGGSARLELTGDDLLTTGVEVIARPPGKKNSTIHLLSGGEKALTAISLVFSLFQLNPAPFCMLDEVDAPLDDTNVLRFCNLVREISKKVQIIFISHNKVAIEMGQHLIGVTMQEPGVSRIVSVDVEEAVAMAEEA
ncbi:MAG: chromosome segregation protein SMC [Gammaproteobacteria bacterium RIFCSPHIGHO2_12_FULL_35_23]|nr:MAG: chromosome segregation protein SMC [Gammaproteobacteria bacterium RIFCSPHIGHO2_12_FULL_35_23]